MSKYLHVRADFDEKVLHSKIYDTIDDYIEDNLDGFSNYAELEQYINECKQDGEEPEYHPKYVYDLINSGSGEGEWDEEAFYEIKGSITEGI